MKRFIKELRYVLLDTKKPLPGHGWFTRFQQRLTWWRYCRQKAFLHHIATHHFKRRLAKTVVGGDAKCLMAQRPARFNQLVFQFNCWLEKRGWPMVTMRTLRPIDRMFELYYFLEVGFWDVCVYVALKRGWIKEELWHNAMLKD